MVQVHHDEGVANRIDPESCANTREGIGEALTGERIGQPLSRESTLILGADVVPVTEGNTDGRDNASAQTAQRGLRHWHVRTSQGRGPRGMCVSKARAGHSTGEPCHRRWSAYGKLQGKGRRRSSPRSSITSVLITSKKHSPNSKRMLHPGWMGWHVRTTSSTLSAILRTCMLASIGERIGRYRRGGFTYPSRMVGNARSRSPPLRTRSSRGPRLRC